MTTTIGPSRTDKPFTSKESDIKHGLNSSKEEKKREAAKNLVDIMTTGSDVSNLFESVLRCASSTNNFETKKLCYLYLVNFIKNDTENASKAVSKLQGDFMDPNPLIKALAIRTLSLVRVKSTLDYVIDQLKNLLKDPDPYVLKTACISVAKLYENNPEAIEKLGFIDTLRQLVSNGNQMVVSNAVTALCEINEIAPQPVFIIDRNNLSKLLTALDECHEWGVVFILDSLAKYSPGDIHEAQKIVDATLPRLQSANSAVSLAAVKVLIKYLDYFSNPQEVSAIASKIAPPLVTLLSRQPEIQYVALRNINLLLQKRPYLLANDMIVFFYKYNDPLYVNMEKLEIMIMLANEGNIDTVLLEFREYATKVDVEFVRKAVRAIGRSAIKLENAAEKCIHVLVDLIKTTKLNYVVQEAVIVIKDIFRRYPNKYEGVISTLCQNLEILDEPEAKAAMIWILGEYADRIDNADKLLGSFTSSFLEEDSVVQLSLLTAVVKLYLQKPTNTQQMVQNLLQIATTKIDNPDIRDRGFVYWRLLSEKMSAAKAVILSPKPVIRDDAENLDSGILEELIDNMASLASVYHKPPETFVTRLKNKRKNEDIPEDDSPPPLPKSIKKASSIKADDPPPLPPLPKSSSIKVPKFNMIPHMTTLITPDKEGANGLEIVGGFILRSGQLFLDLNFTNHGTEPVGPFMIKFNKNTYQVTPSAPIGIQSVAPGQSQSYSLGCNFSAPVEVQPTDLVQIALKTNGPLTAFFTARLPLFLFFVQEGQVDKDQYYKLWRGIQTEHCADITDIIADDINLIRHKLEAYNIFFVTSNSNSDEEVLFVSAKTVDGSLFLMELAFKGTTCKLSTRTEAKDLVPLLAQSIQLILIVK